MPQSLSASPPTDLTPKFRTNDWDAMLAWAKRLSQEVEELRGQGRHTRGYGTYILNRLWPRASSQKDGLLTNIMYRVLFGLYDINADETTTSGRVYVGIAPKGTATSAASWMMFEFYDLTHAEDPYKMRLADGNELFDNVWDDRASLVYKEVRVDDRNLVVSTED